MAVVPLKKIRVIVPASSTAALMSLLQDAGCSEIIAQGDSPAAPTGEATFTTRQTLAKIEAARDFFARYYSGPFLRTALEGGKAHTSPRELEALKKTASVDDYISQAEQFEQTLAELDRAERLVEEGLHTLHSWERLSLPLHSVTETKHTLTLAVRGPERSLKTTLAKIEAALGTATSVKEVSITTALITCLRSALPTLEEIVSAGGLEVVALPRSTNTAAEEVARLSEEKKVLAERRELVEESIRKTATSVLPMLQKLSDLARWEHEHAVATQNVPQTARTSYVTAWVPKTALPALEKNLAATLPALAIEEMILDAEETPPTALSNSTWLRPFEQVTKLYGVPTYRDLDPTPPLALFFFLFFGLCLSDVGYGLILMVLTGFVLTQFHLDRGTEQLMVLLFFGGIGTVLAGILFGGYFGISLNSIAAAAPNLSFLIELQQFDPINNPLPVFYLSLILGFIHISFGIILNMVRKFRIKETASALLDDGPWLVLFLLITLYAASRTGFMFDSASVLITENATSLFIAAAALIVITQGRSQKNPILKLLFGLLGLYGIVGYFADMLSYSRLMALGLATGALALSINSIALFVGGDSFGLGTLFMIIILIFGHTLNLAISLLGTFINSARLQFVEFFSKFSTGTGRAFTPLQKEPRHVIILPDPPASG